MNLEEHGVPKSGQHSDYRKLQVNERIHGIDPDDPRTTQRLLDLAIELQLINANTLNALPGEFEKRKLILLFAKFIGNRIEYCNVTRDRARIVTRIEMMIPCGLHNNIRIPANLLTNLRRQINERRDLTAVQKKLLGEKLEEIINKSIGSGTSANFTYTVKGGMLQVVSLSCVKLIQVMDNWAALVDVVFAGLDDPDDIELKLKWCDVGERFVDCMLLLNYKYDLVTAAEISRFQLCMDIFCSCYRDLLGRNAETNYIQNMSAGVFKYFVNSYGSIYAYNNTAMEACAGREQDFFQKATQHDVDGDRGKPLIEAFMDHHMIGRAMLMDRLVPGVLKEAVAVGKTTNNNIRNENIKKRKLDQRAMQVDNINIVANRKVRVGYWDDKNKLTYKYIILQVGDQMPAKASRVFSEEESLQRSLVKKLRSS